METPLTPEELNTHFSSIAHNLTSGFPDLIHRLPPYESRKMSDSEFPKFIPHDVVRNLSSIPDKEATGKDGISVAMLKKTLPFTLKSIYRYVKKAETTVMISLDFRKAFDCVDHTLLIKKLKHIGCDMMALKVIISFLDHRTQSVKLNSDESTLKPVLTGVPKGSLLAPTLFLLFINDLLKLPTISRSFAYADDTVCVTSDVDVKALEIQL